MKCPLCGKEPITKETQYGLRHTCCGLWSWNGAELVDKETHDARILAHESFDQLWKKHRWNRTKAYETLAKRLGISKEACHMKLMDKDTAKKVPVIALEMLYSK